MDAFESIIKNILQHKGYWVVQGFKVELNKADKIRIGRPSSPRWEIDVLAYSFKRRECIALECKSYFDSPGVKYRDLLGSGDGIDRYKLFNEFKLRNTVLKRARSQLCHLGMVPKNIKMRLGLAAGHVVSDADDRLIAKRFKAKNWIYWSPKYVREQIIEMAKLGYHDDISMVTAKILNPRWA